MLERIDTKGPADWNKKDKKDENKALIKEISSLQKVLYASTGRSLLIILQGVDASGKDGTIRTIFSGINPLGCNVYGFKKPTEIEMAHDFLWRIHSKVPAKGMIHIFNRSHYEDILVPTVEGFLQAKQVNARYEQINQFEELIQSNGTSILKFYLHVSKEEQLQRLTERTENPTKYWKHKDGDWESRKKREAYKAVYEEIFQKCNSVQWHIIPSDKNWVKINFIAKEILSSLKEMDLSWPDLDSEKFQ